MGIERRKVGPVLSAREVVFIKHSALRDNNLLCSRIVELPALVTRRVANENALFHVGPQCATFVLLYMHICQTSPYAQVRHIRFATIEGLIGRSLGACRGGTAVQDVYQR